MNFIIVCSEYYHKAQDRWWEKNVYVYKGDTEIVSMMSVINNQKIMVRFNIISDNLYILYLHFV